MTVKLGQHFLRDEGMLSKIVEAALIKPDDVILEIGPGKGALTSLLAKNAKRIIAIELDESLKPCLDNLPSNVEVKYGNALELIRGVKLNKIIANIPYAISEPLLKKLFKADFELAILLIGKNFYNIMLLSKDSKWSVITPIFFEINKIIDVPRQAFEPMPRVDSTLIKLSKRQSELSPAEKVIKELVLQEDKKLGNALITSFARVEKLTQKQAKEDVSKLKIELKLLEKRVMHLSNRQFLAVYNKIHGFFRKI